MSTKAEQFRYREERDPKKKKKDDGHHVKRASRMTKRKAADGTPAHDNARAGSKSTTKKETGTRKSTRKTKKGMREDTNLELRDERAQRTPEAQARRSHARVVRPRGGTATKAGSR